MRRITVEAVIRLTRKHGRVALLFCLGFGLYSMSPWAFGGALKSALGTANASGPNDSPYWSSTAGYAKAHGHRLLTNRPVDVQSVMNFMYTNQDKYAQVSGLFVDHSPGDAVSSLRFSLQRPGDVRTAAYSSDDASGVPYELTQGSGATLTVYNPGTQSETTLRQTETAVEPLANVPLSVMPLVTSYTSIRGLKSGGAAWLADMFVHPAIFITSAFFANKDVQIQSETILDGRATWVLEAQQNAADQTVTSLGNRWLAWVDKRTGIVVKVEYYFGPTLLGYGKIEDLNIDGAGHAPQRLGIGPSAIQRAHFVPLQRFTAQNNRPISSEWKRH